MRGLVFSRFRPARSLRCAFQAQTGFSARPVPDGEVEAQRTSFQVPCVVPDGAGIGSRVVYFAIFTSRGVRCVDHSSERKYLTLRRLGEPASFDGMGL